jgi:hypothetical protein
LRDVRYVDGTMQASRRPTMLPEGGLPAYLERARALLDELERTMPTPLPHPPTTTDFEQLRWFHYADEH